MPARSGVVATRGGAYAVREWLLRALVVRRRVRCICNHLHEFSRLIVLQSLSRFLSFVFQDVVTRY